jgi:hypothetical protein
MREYTMLNKNQNIVSQAKCNIIHSRLLLANVADSQPFAV